MVIYFDNAATSWPKPPPVRAALDDYLGAAGGNPGRSGHRMSISAGRILENARETLAGLFNAGDPSRIIFTQNGTHALNIALYGVVRPGDHVVTTSLEHNSVMRPLRHLESTGVGVAVVPCSKDGTIAIEQVRRAIRDNTRLIVTTHGSNVTGTILPIADLATLARERGILYLVDASQTAGSVPLDVEEIGVDLVAFTGHKGLMGPTGTGGLFIREGVAITPLLRGGTGSDSAHEIQPEFLPDAHESGTMNVAGLAGLGAGVSWVRAIGVDRIRTHEQKLVTHFLEGASEIPRLMTYVSANPASRCGIVSFNIEGAMPSEVGLILDESFGIMARTGLHCAPSAHRTLGTFPHGAVRFSFGWFNTAAEIDSALQALREIGAWATKGAKAWMA
jgi:cysteine desulfurase family protein